MTIAELIKELRNFDPDTDIRCDGFEEPALEWATLYDFKIVGDDGYLAPDDSAAKRVLVISGAGDDRPEAAGSGHYRLKQPHFIKYDCDGVVRS